MDLTVEQACPQCGGSLTLRTSDHVLACPFCGVKSFLQSAGSFRYVLPDKMNVVERDRLLYAPYIRFKGNVFAVTGNEIRHKVIDTTQLGFELPGLPPSLGVRPQAMKLQRLTEETGGRYLRLSLKARVILERAVNLSSLRTSKRKQQILYRDDGTVKINTSWQMDNGGRDNFIHRAFIGESISFIYLPMLIDDKTMRDAITKRVLVKDIGEVSDRPLQGGPFNKRWQIGFQSTLCPKCGWSLDGQGDCVIMTCSNCDTSWELSDRGLRRIAWQIVKGDDSTTRYLAFWRIAAHVPELGIYSFADFIERTNQPLAKQQGWHDRVMSFWIPAFKVRPKYFLKSARQATLSQNKCDVQDGRVPENLYPVTLPESEAKQAMKVTLAACTTSPQKVYPHLPQVRFKQTVASLVLLPFASRGRDLLQPQTGIVIPETVLRLGRSL